jgi:hypothetical protein
LEILGGPEVKKREGKVRKLEENLEGEMKTNI